MGRAIDCEQQFRCSFKIITTLCIFVAVISDGVAGNKMTNLPGGVKCADLLNNDQPVCVFEIQIDSITAGTPADVRYLLDHRDSYVQKIWGSGVRFNSLGGDVAAATC